MTLRLKLFVLIGGAIFFATSGVTAMALWRDVIRGQELLVREGVALASTAAAASSHWIGTHGAEPGAPQALPAILDRLLRSAPLDRAWVVDRSGSVLGCASRTGEPCPEGFMPTEFQSADWALQALKRLITPEGIVARAPVLHGGEVVGAVCVDFSHEEVIGSARDLAVGASVVGAVWISLGLMMAGLFIRQVTKPVVDLIEAAGHLAEEKDAPSLNCSAPPRSSSTGRYPPTTRPVAGRILPSPGPNSAGSRPPPWRTACPGRPFTWPRMLESPDHRLWFEPSPLGRGGGAARQLQVI